ncbi:MAG: hypothetical protein COA82_03705 [Alkaliphilus sp.]|nr:MAG: hypothetical protein COA82_03705 [Alkaliphilus sp.]
MDKHGLKRFSAGAFTGTTLEEFELWVDGVINVDRPKLDRGELNLAFKGLATLIDGSMAVDTNFLKSPITASPSSFVFHDGNATTLGFLNLLRFQMNITDGTEVASFQMRTGGNSVQLSQNNSAASTAAVVDLIATGTSYFGGSKVGEVLVSTKEVANTTIRTGSMLQMQQDGLTLPYNEYSAYTFPLTIAAGDIGKVLTAVSTTELALTALPSGTVNDADEGLIISGGNTVLLGHGATGTGVSDFKSHRYIYTDTYDLEIRGTGGYTIFEGSSGMFGIGAVPTQLLNLGIGNLKLDEGYVQVTAGAVIKNIFLGYNNAGVNTYDFKHSNSNGAMLELDNSSSVNTIRLRSDGNSYINGGNLGINFSAPTEKLEVDGKITSDSSTGFQLGNSDQTVIGAWYNFSGVNRYTGGTVAVPGTRDFEWYNGIRVVVHFDMAGENVGIGTITPSAKLEVLGTTMLLNGDGNNVFHTITSGATNKSANLLFSNTSNRFSFDMPANTNDFQFRSLNGGVPVSIYSKYDDGRVGIGMTDPDYSLEVTSSDSTNSTMGLHSTATGVNDFAGLILKNGQNITSSFSLSNSNYVPVNGALPDQLQMSSNTLALAATHASGVIRFFTGGLASASGKQRMEIGTTGNIIWNNYGVKTHVGTQAYSLGVTATGDVIEMDWLHNQIPVRQSNIATTLGGTIDVTKEYFITEIIDMGTTQIDLSGGKDLNINGHNFELSGLTSSENNYTMIVGADCGNVLIKNVHFSVTGTLSQVEDLTDTDGTHTHELTGVNYIACTAVGELTDFRQGTETNTGRFGGTPELTLSGPWSGGYFIFRSIARNLTDGSYFLYKAGTAFVMSSRFSSNANLDLNATVGFFDFSASNFASASLLQIQKAIITRNGVIDGGDTTITPNITKDALESAWEGNTGLGNTFVGASMKITTEVETTISTQSVFVDLAGTFTTSNLVHFDSPANGQLRHLGSSPREFDVIVASIIDGGSNDELDLRLTVWDNSASTFVQYKVVRRVVNNLQGGRDVAFIPIFGSVILDTNDYIKMTVANDTDTSNVTGELETELIIKAR